MERDTDQFLGGALTSLAKGRQKIFSRIGLWISALALLVAIVITFTDVSILALSAESLTLKMAIYAAVTAIMFFALEEEGERAGREEGTYKKNEKAFLAAKAAVTPMHYGALEKFCARYVEEELSERRAVLLLSHGITDRDAPLPAQIERKMKALKPLEVSAASLLDPSTHPERSPLSDPERRRKRRLAVRLLPSLLCSIFGIGIAVGVRGALTPSAIIEGLFKISALLIVALRGYAVGYLFIGDAQIPFLQAKTRLLEQFLYEQNISIHPTDT
jgi:hypothetical protein